VQQHQQDNNVGGGKASLGAPSSLGFAPAEFPVADNSGGGDIGEGGSTAAEVAALREENESFKKELRKARARPETGTG